MTNFHFCRTLTQIGRKPRLKHQKRYYCSSRVSKSLALETRNMQPLVTTTTLKTHTELCTPKLTEPEPTADSLIVSIPLQKLPSQTLHVPKLSEPEPCSLVVSISLAQYKDAPVDSLASLMRRVVSRAFSFPPGWVHVSSVATELVICKMEMKGKESIAVITFRVITDLSWTLTALGREVVIPDDFPCHKCVSSVGALTTILSALLDYEVCMGNHKQAYVDLCQARGGKFYDCTGTYIIIIQSHFHMHIVMYN